MPEYWRRSRRESQQWLFKIAVRRRHCARAGEDRVVMPKSASRLVLQFCREHGICTTCKIRWTDGPKRTCVHCLQQLHKRIERSRGRVTVGRSLGTGQTLVRPAATRTNSVL